MRWGPRWLVGECAKPSNIFFGSTKRFMNREDQVGLLFDPQEALVGLSCIKVDPGADSRRGRVERGWWIKVLVYGTEARDDGSAPFGVDGNGLATSAVTRNKEKLDTRKKFVVAFDDCIIKFVSILRKPPIHIAIDRVRIPGLLKLGPLHIDLCVTALPGIADVVMVKVCLDDNVHIIRGDPDPGQTHFEGIDVLPSS